MWLAFALLYAGHGVYLGGESPLWGQSRNCQPLAKHQGCPSRGGIWKKMKAKSRIEEHESHQADNGGEYAIQYKAIKDTTNCYT